MLDAIRRTPKLLPLHGLTRYIRLFREDITLDSLTSLLPETVYDICTVDGMKFKTRLFRPADAIIARGQHEHAFMHARPRPGEIVADIGANIGAYTLRYARMVGHLGTVFAFEPEPHTFRLLTDNMRLNFAVNVVPMRFAIGDYDGTASFHISPTVTNHSLVYSHPRGQELQVPIRMLDTALLNGHVDFIKVDAEGAEMQVLRGAKNILEGLHPRLQIEVHHPHIPDCDVCNYLNYFDYTTTWRTQPRSPLHWVTAE